MIEIVIMNKQEELVKEQLSKVQFADLSIIYSKHNLAALLHSAELLRTVLEK